MFEWGNFDELTRGIPKEQLAEIDWVLGSDCLYETDKFEDLFVSVYYIFTFNASCVFYTTYHMRSVNRTIAQWLEHYDMEARVRQEDDEQAIYLLEIKPKWTQLRLLS